LELDGHERLEGDHLSIARCSGRVHRDVGVAESFVGVVLAVAHRLPDARADEELAGDDDDGLLEDSVDASGDLVDHHLVDQFVDHHGELVTADSCQGVAGAKDPAHPGRDLDEHGVSGVVSRRRIDLP
jgi:hypothetical protein